MPPAITSEEVLQQLKKMRPRKAADERGIGAELISSGSSNLVSMIAHLFTDILAPGSAVPDSWKSSSIRLSPFQER